MDRLNAQQLRTQLPNEQLKKNIKKNPVYIILDSVLDTYNVGAIFRLADAVAAQKIFLCGDTETPPNPRIKKASINTAGWVEWEYVESASKAILNLKSKILNLHVVIIEQHPKSIPLSKLKPSFPMAVVVGNETYGVSDEVIQTADTIVELPMYGINKSLNVMVTCGIVLYKILEFIDQ